MKILMIPDFSEVNAYQRKLRTGLETHGATVIVSDSIGYFALLSAVWKYGLPDVLHLHWLKPFVISSNPVKTAAGGLRLLSELFLLKMMGVTIVWTVHNVVEHQELTPRLEKLIKHFVVRFSDSVIIHCSAAREMIIEAYHLPQKVRRKCHIIPHGHYIGSYRNDQTQREARSTIEAEFNDSQIVYLFFGQIRPYKNIPELIKEFKKLKKENVQLLIVGNPWDEEEAKRVHQLAQTDSRIQCIFEFIPDDEIQLYMNAADIVVLPFEKVTTSGSAILAMSFAKALIAPNIGCVGELVDTEGGFVYDPEDEEGLLQAMKRASNADLQAMGKYNYLKSEQFDWATIAKQTQRAYESHDMSSRTKE